MLIVKVYISYTPVYETSLDGESIVKNSCKVGFKAPEVSLVREEKKAAKCIAHVGKVHKRTSREYALCSRQSKHRRPLH